MVGSSPGHSHCRALGTWVDCPSFLGHAPIPPFVMPGSLWPLCTERFCLCCHTPPALPVSSRSLAARTSSWPLPGWDTCQGRLQGRESSHSSCTTCCRPPAAAPARGRPREELRPEALLGAPKASFAQLSAGRGFRGTWTWPVTMVGNRGAWSSLPLAQSSHASH
jgi:hypothetical protein